MSNSLPEAGSGAVLDNAAQASKMDVLSLGREVKPQATNDTAGKFVR